MLAGFVLENANNPGTGAITPAGASAGRRSISSAFSAGTVLYYGLDDGTQSEWGWTTSGVTLTRNVLGNSAGSTAPLNFTGACRVYCTLPAERTLWADQVSVWQGQGRRFANLAQGTSAFDAMRLDQGGMILITKSVSNTPQSAVVFSLPSAYARFLFSIEDMAPVTPAPAFVRFSYDGGTTYASGAAEYVAQSLASNGSTTTSAAATAAFQAISAPNATVLRGEVEIAQTAALSRFSIDTKISGGIVLNRGAWSNATAGNPTHILFGFVGSGISNVRIHQSGLLA